jgi:hypothetical protein
MMNLGKNLHTQFSACLTLLAPLLFPLSTLAQNRIAPGPNPLSPFPISSEILGAPDFDSYDLNDGFLISAEVVRHFDTRTIGKSVAFRIHDRYTRVHDQVANGRIAIDFKKEGEIQIRFDAKNIEFILKQGFLNEYQTGTSGGHLDFSRREIAENRIAGLNFGMPTSGDTEIREKIRPKYATLKIEENAFVGEEEEPVEAYGSLIAVMKRFASRRLQSSAWTHLQRMRERCRITRRTLVRRSPDVCFSCFPEFRSHSFLRED